MNKRIQTLALFSFFLLIFSGCENSEKESIVTNAIYNGEKDMAWAIAHYIEYPVDEMQFNRAGIVKVTFFINEDGNVSEVKASLDEEIKAAEIAVGRKKIEGKDELAINFSVLQSLIKSVEKLNFYPAKKNGKPISSIVTTSVEFILI
jgi:hypothetical protein